MMSHTTELQATPKSAGFSHKCSPIPNMTPDLTSQSGNQTRVKSSSSKQSCQWDCCRPLPVESSTVSAGPMCPLRNSQANKLIRLIPHQGGTAIEKGQDTPHTTDWPKNDQLSPCATVAQNHRAASRQNGHWQPLTRTAGSRSQYLHDTSDQL